MKENNGLNPNHRLGSPGPEGAQGGKMRLRILLIILGVVIVAFGIVFYYYGPYSEAAKGGIKGKPSKTPTIAPSASASESPSPGITSASSSPAEVLFSDDFSGSLSKWQVVYTSANIVSDQLSLIPSNQTYNLPTDTHAPLIVAGDTAWKDYVYNVKMKTVKQLRPSNPNPWEVGWILFRYQDAQHFYYFIPKINGIELGKFINGAQTFLYTNDNPKLSLNNWNSYKISVDGSNIKIYTNGSKIIDYTDSSPISSGKIGLYNEDAETLNDNVLVTSN